VVAVVVVVVVVSEPSSSPFISAQNACRSIMPAQGNGGSSDHGPGKHVLLAFGICLRAHGVTGFPDPDASGQLSIEMIKAAGVDIHTRRFLDTAKACVGVTPGAITVAQLQTAINATTDRSD